MLFQARVDFGIDIGSSFMVGDKISDILAGQRAGVAGTVLIPSHQTRRESFSGVEPTYVADDLLQASRLILDHPAKNDAQPDR